MTHDEAMKMYDQWRADEFAANNAGIVCRLLRRVAFSRWRRALLYLNLRAPARGCRASGLRWLARRLDWWGDRVGDALYPDDVS